MIRSFGILFLLLAVETSSAQPNIAQSLYQKIAPSIFVLETRDANGKPLAQGSAVSIAPKLVVTNCHVIDGSSSATLRQGQFVARVQVIARDKSVDLCLLSHEATFPAAPLGSGLSVSVGQAVYAVGAPAGLELTLSEGIVSSVRTVGSRKFIQTSAPLSRGSSGGGLFDVNGNLIGITTLSVQGGQNLNFAVPVDYIPTERDTFVESSASKLMRRSYVRQPNEPDWEKKVDIYEVARIANFKTDPSSWSGEGGFGLKWGMGPGDVMAIIPQLTSVSRWGSAETHTGIVKVDVQERLSTVLIHFFRGRLYRVEISGMVLNLPSDLDYDGLMRNRAEGWKWRERLRTIIQQSYGKPACEPSAYSRKMFCDQSGNFCNGDRPEKIHQVLRWVWRSDETEVEIRGASPFGVTYSDLLMVGPMADFNLQLSRNLFAEKERERAADAARLGGQQASTGVTPSAASPSVNLGLAVPELQCVQVAEPSGNQSADPSNWSKAGLNEFRWGMGPGDVKSRLATSGDVSWRPGGRFSADSLFAAHALRLFGHLTHAAFYFKDNNLRSISVSLACDPEKRNDCEDATKRLLNTMDKNYGARRCTTYSEGLQSCQWDALGRVWATGMLSKYGLQSLEFRNPAEMPSRVLPSAIGSNSSQRDWSKNGWNRFRWGMSFSDIDKLVKDSAGGIRAKSDMACYQDEKNGPVKCNLERDFHTFDVSGIKPSFRFDLIGGRLVAIRLEFKQGIKRDDYWATAQRLRDQMLDRYGSADDRREDTKPFKSMAILWSKQDFKASLHAYEIGEPPEVTITYEAPDVDLTRRAPSVDSKL